MIGLYAAQTVHDMGVRVAADSTLPDLSQHGIIADFSHISVPSVPSYHIGLAQLEEIQDALLELRKAKEERLGKGKWRTVAWTDSFTSQGQYMFATGERQCPQVSCATLSLTCPFLPKHLTKFTLSLPEKCRSSEWVCRLTSHARQLLKGLSYNCRYHNALFWTPSQVAWYRRAC